MIMTTTFSHRLSPLILGCAAALILDGLRIAVACADRRRHGQRRTHHQLRHRAAQQAGLPVDPQACRSAAGDQRTDRRKGEDQGSKEIRHRPFRLRYRSVLCRDELTDADHAGSADEIAGEPGHSARDAEGPHARPTWSGPAWSADATRKAFRSARRKSPPRPRAARATRSRKPTRFEYKMQPIVLIVPRGSAPAAIEARQKEAEALRSRVQTCDEANAFFKSMQNAAIRETVIKTSADIPAVLREVLDKHSDRPFDPARGDQAGRRDGRAVRQEADHRRHAEKEGNPGQDVCREIRGEVEIVSAGSPQSRDDRISLTHGKAPRADIRRTRRYRTRHHHQGVAAPQ